MNIRVLRYFLAVAREQSFSVAAQRLYLSQPTLSRQIKDLEEELGKPLFVRGGKCLSLTEEGRILRERAEEIVELVDKTAQEVRQSDEHISGTIYIGAGETPSVSMVAGTAQQLRKHYPGIHLSIFSGDGQDVIEKLDRGNLDFGIIFHQPDPANYEMIPLPVKDHWGILIRQDCPLAEKEAVTVEDLRNKPLILPRQRNHNEMLTKLFGTGKKPLNCVAEYNLVYNGSVMVREGIGYAVALDGLINVTGESDLCFKPFKPGIEAECYFVWKKNAVFSKAAVKFLEMFRERFSSENRKK